MRAWELRVRAWETVECESVGAECESRAREVRERVANGLDWCGVVRCAVGDLHSALASARRRARTAARDRSMVLRCCFVVT